MAHNLLYPGFIKLFYTSVSLDHVAILPCVPEISGTPSVYRLVNKAGTSPQTWQDEIDDYVAVAKALLPSSTGVFTSAELWTIETEESDPIFREVHPLGVAATGSGTPGAPGQLVHTARTQEGGISKQYLLGVITGANGRFLPPSFSANAAIEAWADYVVSAATWIVGRDTSYPIASIKVLSKTNDALRRRANLT